MALFDDNLAQEVVRLLQRRYQSLGAALGVADTSIPLQQGNGLSPLQRDLRLLIGIANGEFQRTPERVQQAELALTCLQELLLGNALQSRAPFPEDFWRSDMGILFSRVRWWISVDDLITISNAAALAFGANTQANRMRIVRAIDNGILSSFPDPSVANPQQNKRVLRSQVERLGEQRRLPAIE
ncbi:hypothetical protein [Dictyobacter kobayashii]|uniref:Uncharacterized protein n=1 Tax=Dictyobacter kobayashii TaxID=2014872 RepID=A0A402AR71_9CHLR|nr:hypothetical protein [Dictyobacter kobayashii]GCE21592.1 hypothetical protein KDK_53920 [Dictyobacter kobayashii]